MVRTRLQALIALQMVRAGVISRDFLLVRMYWKRRDEDHESINILFDRLSNDAIATIEMYTDRPVITNVAQLLRVTGPARRSNGVLFGANLTFLPLAIVLKLLPALRFRSLDDGRANVLQSSTYFEPHPAKVQGLADRASRLISPEGPAAYLRSRSERHYTIYPGMPNVVDDARLETISIDWLALLSRDDEDDLSADVRTLLLGTVVADMADPDAVKAHLIRLRPQVDLHVIHPRESDKEALAGGVRLHSPAEAVIASLSAGRPLIVYHFTSSAVLPFAEDPNVQTIDLLEQV